MCTVQVDTAECLWGAIVVLPSRKSQILSYPPVSDRYLNLHCYFKNFDYFVNEVANFKVPESNKDDHKILTWIISYLYAVCGVACSQIDK